MADYECGDQPGDGLYQCDGCGEVVDITDSSITLAPCSSCGCCSWLDRCSED
ncbi:hypothetical protein MBCUT_02260 [Methanobrevibacter cuticularis]|uniref:Zinc ribbon domain protein n=1 Tax=Methanobrevibacter cuticularis TaxID=47311 RepID=A0A166F6C1_9EURY|nr:hypothetical protein [Methanobrevibacter cuticularis]KZX17360.1 hypothetical protein MBCUT_02260 [Methanobrevibacter cuticularis]